MKLFGRNAGQQTRERKLTGNCPIREHTADGAYVGRCCFPCWDNVCPRHGRLSMYPNRDDREVANADRNFDADVDALERKLA